MDEKKSGDVFPIPADGGDPVPPAKSAKPDRALIRAEVKQGRAEGAQYLKEKKACSTSAEAKAFRKKWRQRKKEWKTELKALDAPQQIARKKGRRAFQHRIHRAGRIFRTVIALLLLVCLIGFGAPSLLTAWRIHRSQKYTNAGADVEIARAAGYALSSEIYDEGIVLLKNDDGFLPLSDKRLNLFGDDAYAFSSGRSTLSDALLAQGIACNPGLARAYTGQEDPGMLDKLTAKALSLLPGQKAGEEGWFLPDEKILDEARSFSDQALIVFSAGSEDGKDLSLEALQPSAPGTRKAETLDTVCREFEHVIVVICSGNVMELGFLDTYDSIDAVIWLGEQDGSGCTALAKVLSGALNPSGRTTDTWPYFLNFSPASAASVSSYYANLSGVRTMDLSEGIYVGYRYYETRFGLNEAEYAQHVIYPFGYGLSYTAFTEELTALSEEDGILTADVTVKNTGDVPGKDVVELYFLPPFEEGSLPERSAIELAAFARTDELAPGEEATITLSFPLRDLSCWSAENGCYLLPAGDYAVAVGKNVHDALLSETTEIYTVEEEQTFASDDATGAELAGRFAFAAGENPTLSRTAWEETYPAPTSRLLASDDLKRTVNTYGQTEEAIPLKSAGPAESSGSAPKLSELKGLPYDDEAWDAFLDVFSTNEMIRLVGNGAYHTEAAARLGVPAMRFLGGDAGLVSPYSKLDAVSYPSAAVMGATWNTALAEVLGKTIAAEAVAYGVNGWYAPNAGVRRTAMDAGNEQTFSEDPLLSGKMAAAEIRSAQAGGLITFVQGFLFGTSSSLEGGVCLHVGEQALRELWLRPFELAVKEGGASGITVSSTRLDVEWCSTCSALLQSVLREEWGFCGFVSTGSPSISWRAVPLSVQNGTDLFFDKGCSYTELILTIANLRDPAGTRQHLRSAVHDLCYTIVNTAM